MSKIARTQICTYQYINTTLNHILLILILKMCIRDRGWKVENPGALKTDQTSTFKIKYNELSCDLKIKCTTLSKR